MRAGPQQLLNYYHLTPVTRHTLSSFVYFIHVMIFRRYPITAHIIRFFSFFE